MGSPLSTCPENVFFTTLVHTNHIVGLFTLHYLQRAGLQKLWDVLQFWTDSEKKDGDHLQDNFDNNSDYGHQQYDQEKDVESG